MLTSGTLLFKNNLISTLRNDMDLWDLDYAEKNARESIIKRIKYLNIFCILTSLLALVAGFFYTKRQSLDIKLFYAYRFFKDYFPKQEFILSVFYRSTFPFRCIIMIAHAFQCIYYTQHICFQLIMFQQYVLEMLNISDKENQQLFYDENYQKQINQNMIYCIKRHQQFIE